MKAQSEFEADCLVSIQRWSPSKCQPVQWTIALSTRDYSEISAALSQQIRWFHSSEIQKPFVNITRVVHQKFMGQAKLKECENNNELKKNEKKMLKFRLRDLTAMTKVGIASKHHSRLCVWPESVNSKQRPRLFSAEQVNRAETKLGKRSITAEDSVQHTISDCLFTMFTHSVWNDDNKLVSIQSQTSSGKTQQSTLATALIYVGKM